jgi:hypothetical protein
VLRHVTRVLALSLLLAACSDEQTPTEASAPDALVAIDRTQLEASRLALQDVLDRVAVQSTDVRSGLFQLARSIDEEDVTVARRQTQGIMSALTRLDPDARDPELEVIRLTLGSVSTTLNGNQELDR